MTVNMYPLDVTTLQKGQVLTVPELLFHLGLTSVDVLWGLHLVQFRDDINDQRVRLGLEPFTMKCRKGELVICTDAAAAKHNAAAGRRGIRKYKRSCALNRYVDMKNLTAEEAADHSHQLRRQAVILIAITGAQHKPLALPGAQARVTPRAIAQPVNGNGQATEASVQP